MPYDVIVLGGGPSGLSAATYLAEHRFRVILLDGNWRKNQIEDRPSVVMFPGSSPSDPEVFQNMRKAYEAAGGRFEEYDAQKVLLSAKSKMITSSRGDTFSAQAMIVATGVGSNNSYFTGERQFMGKGLFYDFASAQIGRNNSAVIVGKSAEAASAAVRLSDSMAKTTFVIPANRIEVSEDRWQEIRSRRPNLNLVFSASLKEIRGTSAVEEAIIFTAGKEEHIKADCVFLFTHDFKPRTQFLTQLVELGPSAEIMVDEKFSTSSPGIFAAGDVLCNKPQMPIFCSAQGICAAQSAEQYILEI